MYCDVRDKKEQLNDHCTIYLDVVIGGLSFEYFKLSRQYSDTLEGIIPKTIYKYQKPVGTNDERFVNAVEMEQDAVITISDG